MATNLTPENGAIEKGLQSDTQKNGELRTNSDSIAPSLGKGKVEDLIVDTVNAETEYTPEQFAS